MKQNQHGNRDFPYVFYVDQLKTQQEPFKAKLKSILGMNLTQADLERLNPDDLEKVEKLAEEAEQSYKN